jgi:hypothetical protein
VKKILILFAAGLLITSCAPVQKDVKPGTLEIWTDDQGDIHREFKGDDGSYSHLVNGVLVELKVVRK